VEKKKKKKPTATNKAQPKVPPPKPSGGTGRCERIAIGHEVLGQVEKKISESFLRNGGLASLGSSGISEKTEKKYLKEAIASYAVNAKLNESEIEINVQLAELAERFVGEELQAAIRNGDLQLRPELLKSLSKITDLDKLKKELSTLLSTQV